MTKEEFNKVKRQYPFTPQECFQPATTTEELNELINRLERVMLNRDYSNQWLEITFCRLRSLIVIKDSDLRLEQRMNETGIRRKQGGGFERLKS